MQVRLPHTDQYIRERCHTHTTKTLKRQFFGRKKFMKTQKYGHFCVVRENLWLTVILKL